MASQPLPLRAALIGVLTCALTALSVTSLEACTLCTLAAQCPLHGDTLSTAGGEPVATFQVDDRWGDFAGGIAVGSAGVQGDPITLTWSIVPDGTTIDPAITGESNDPSNLISMLDTEFGSSSIWMPLIEDSFNRWSELSGLTFVHEPNDDGQPIAGTTAHEGIVGVRGDIRLSGHSVDGSSGTLAYNYFPNVGDMVVDTADGAFFDNPTNNFRAFRNTIMHEIGHGLGFAHLESSDGSFLMEPFLGTSFDGPQLDDILAVHRNYGDVHEKNGGNDTAAGATALGLIGDMQTVSIGTDAGDTTVGSAEVDFVSIDDNSDVDFFSFLVDGPSALDATLTPMGPTYSEGPQDGTQTALDTSALSDLSLSIFDTDGTSLLASADNGALGDAEFLSNVALAEAGTYFVSVGGADNNVQLYQLDLAVTAVPEPAAATLAVAALLLAGAVVVRRSMARRQPR